MDESGVKIGLYMVSSNSKKARQLYRQMHESLLQFRDAAETRLGRPVVSEEKSKTELDAMETWKNTVKPELEALLTEESSRLTLEVIAGCCEGIQGRIELDDGSMAVEPIQLLKNQEWIADIAYSFHKSLANWVPKQPAS